MNARVPAAPQMDADSVELEACVLGTLLQAPEAAINLSRLSERLFTDPVCRILFPHIRDAIRQYGRADRPVILSLMRIEAPDQVSMQAFVAGLMSRAMPAASMPGMVGALISAWQARELAAVTERTIAALTAGTRPEDVARDLVAEADTVLAATRRRHQIAASAHTAAVELVDSLDREDPEPPISTGLPDLDRQIGGFRRGNLVIIAGRPGMMKSTLLGATILNAARREAGAIIHSMEMPRDQFVARLLTDIAYTSVDALTYEAVMNRTGLGPHHVERLRRATEELRSLPLLIDPQPGLGVAEISSRVRTKAEAMARRGVRLGVIGVDHLGKVRTVERRGESNRSLELGEITNGLAELARDVDACVVLLCQLNRGVESRDNKRPQLGDLRESGRIEEDADTVVGLYREAYYLAKQHQDDAEKEITRAEKLARCAHDLEAIVLKNRHGGEGVVKLWVDAPTAAVRLVEKRAFV